jgi:hypothetical protein
MMIKRIRGDTTRFFLCDCFVVVKVALHFLGLLHRSQGHFISIPVVIEMAF